MCLTNIKTFDTIKVMIEKASVLSPLITLITVSISIVIVGVIIAIIFKSFKRANKRFFGRNFEDFEKWKAEEMFKDDETINKEKNTEANCKCSYCGAKLKANETKCSNCGAKRE